MFFHLSINKNKTSSIIRILKSISKNDQLPVGTNRTELWFCCFVLFLIAICCDCWIFYILSLYIYKIYIGYFNPIWISFFPVSFFLLPYLFVSFHCVVVASNTNIYIIDYLYIDFFSLFYSVRFDDWYMAENYPLIVNYCVRSWLMIRSTDRLGVDLIIIINIIETKLDDHKMNKKRETKNMRINKWLKERKAI